MCERGLAPPDEPHKRYRKLTWWLVSKGLYPWALALARRCSGNHARAPLEGPLPYDLTNEQAEHYNASSAGRLAAAGQRGLLGLGHRIAFAGASAQGVRSSKAWREPRFGSDLLRPYNELIAKLGPENFHWSLVEFKRGDKPYAAL